MTGLEREIAYLRSLVRYEIYNGYDNPERIYHGTCPACTNTIELTNDTGTVLDHLSDGVFPCTYAGHPLAYELKCGECDSYASVNEYSMRWLPHLDPFTQQRCHNSWQKTHG